MDVMQKRAVRLMTAITNTDANRVEFTPNWAFGIDAGMVTNLHDRAYQRRQGDAVVHAREVAAWRGWDR